MIGDKVSFQSVDHRQGIRTGTVVDESGDKVRVMDVPEDLLDGKNWTWSEWVGPDQIVVAETSEAAATDDPGPVVAPAASSASGQVTVGPVAPYRYSASCWNDSCPDSLDTYWNPGQHEEFMEIVREHVARHGCPIDIQVSGRIEVRADAPNETATS